ncbi:MAG TPA: hypothetical protein VK147_02705 [Candidatus Didemnitutus sp.]|nr:hypothetical protein [Candidatus Didemnitutus sp.]
MIALRLLGMFVVIVSIVGCESGVITFPTPDPAAVRIVNTTQNVPIVRVTMDSTINVDVARGLTTEYTPVAAGRPITFQIGSPTTLYRDNLRYTLGGNGRVILFVRGDTSSLVEFRREIQDTMLSPGTTSSVIRFTHMAENVDRAYFLEVWITGGTRLLPEEYEPGISSPFYHGIEPGTYSFEVREGGTTNVLAVLPNVQISSGRSYMLYTYDAEPPTLDRISLSIF